MGLYTGEKIGQQSVQPDMSGDSGRTNHEIQQSQNGDKAEIDLADHFLSVFLGIVIVEVGLLGGKTDVRILVVIDFDVVNLLDILLHRVSRRSVGGVWRHGEYQVSPWSYLWQAMTMRRIAVDKMMKQIGSMAPKTL